MCEQCKETLERIYDELSGDKYESLGLWTIGGPAGNYQLRTPVNTECEYLVVGAYLAASSGNGVVIITNNNPIQNFTLNTALGASSAGSDMNNSFEGVVLPTGASINSLIAVDFWMPLGRGASVYALVTGTASYALIALRRRLDRSIPIPVRRFPTTHALPVSRRMQRTLPAQGPFVAGFEEQYPEPGGRPYQHNPLPPGDPGWRGPGVRR